MGVIVSNVQPKLWPECGKMLWKYQPGSLEKFRPEVIIELKVIVEKCGTLVLLNSVLCHTDHKIATLLLEKSDFCLSATVLASNLLYKQFKNPDNKQSGSG